MLLSPPFRAHSEPVYGEDELAQIEKLNRKLFRAWSDKAREVERQSALRCYLRTMSLLHRRLRMPALSKVPEGFFRLVGLTALFGSPVVLEARRKMAAPR